MLPVVSLLLAAAGPMATAASLDTDRAAHTAVLTTHAEGAQIYQCQAGPDGASHWVFREPIAALMVGGRTVGRHYAGPHWALDDGSTVQGKVAMSAAGATGADVALLKLDVVNSQGQGGLTTATLVYRLNTHGGVLTGVCPTLGALKAVAYSADYVFAR